MQSNIHQFVRGSTGQTTALCGAIEIVVSEDGRAVWLLYVQKIQTLPSWLPCSNCLPYFMWLFVLCGSSSWYFGLVCSVWFWYFLIMLIYFCMLIVKRETTFLYISTAKVWTCLYVHLHILTRNFWERSGSVVKCISRDWPIAGSSLICVTAFCHWSNHINPCLIVVQQRKIRPDIAEKLLNQIIQTT